MSEARMKLQAKLDQRWAELANQLRVQGLDSWDTMAKRARAFADGLGDPLSEIEVGVLLDFALVAMMEASLRAGDQIVEEQAK